MSDEDFIERRQYRRVKVNIPVRYREIVSDDYTRSGRLPNSSSCVDISRGGMQLLTDSPCCNSGGKLLETEFVMSGRKIRIIACVAWSKFDGNIKKFRSGVEFIVIKSGDLEVIGQIA